MKKLTTCLLSACVLLQIGVGALADQPPAPSQIHSPKDLPYYDIKWAKSLTLSDMHARIVSRDRLGSFEVLSIQFDAFDQPIVGPKGVQTVRWRQHAALVLPPAPLRVDKALTFNVHDDDFGDKARPRSDVGMALSVAKAFGIPVMIHGWMPDVVKEVDGKIFHDTQDMVMRRLLAAHIEAAKDLPMDGRYLFNGNPLAKGDMVALTLLQRIVAQERGVNIREFASAGGSKEGQSHWILGAVDDRVAVLAPGGLYWHDTREMLERYRKDWNWRFPWKGGDKPEWDGLRSLFQTLWKLSDWILSTEAGQLVARTTTDPASWYSDVHARQVVIFGDLGLTPGQHDGPWPFWAENKPLSSFKHPAWRYVRIYDGSGALMDEKGIDEMGLSLLPQLADALVNDSRLPDTPVVDVKTIAARQVQIRVNVHFAPGLAHEVLVLYAMSAERGLRDRESWHTEQLQASRSGAWSGSLPPVPAGQGLALIVVARERVKAGELSYWRSASSLPIERFPLPQFDNNPGPGWRE